jgi:hypothetical protein
LIDGGGIGLACCVEDDDGGFGLVGSVTDDGCSAGTTNVVEEGNPDQRGRALRHLGQVLAETLEVLGPLHHQKHAVPCGRPRVGVSGEVPGEDRPHRQNQTEQR